MCVDCLCFHDSVEELCAVDLYEADNRDNHANINLLLSACKQLHQSGLLNSVLHTQVPNDPMYGILFVYIYEFVRPFYLS